MDFRIAYRMIKRGSGRVIVAVPPRLEVTVTDVGGKNIPGVVDVSAITFAMSVLQHGVGPQNAIAVPTGSAPNSVSGTVIGCAVLPSMVKGSVLLTKVAVIVMPIGAGRAVEVTTIPNLPNSVGAPTLLTMAW